MAEASRVVLKGFELGTDALVVRYPHRYSDERGAKMWAEVTSLVEQINTATAVS
jgi:DNA polymerase I